MGMFDNNANYGSGGYLRQEGDFYLNIISIDYDDTYFPKYKVEAEVASGSHAGEFVQGQITKPTEKYMKDNDRALGGFSFSQVGAYVVGAGITAEVNALSKITVGAIAKMLIGKTIKARVQLTYKSQQLKDQGETTGLYYEIGRIYKRTDWKMDDMDIEPNRLPEPTETFNDPSFDEPIGDEDQLPF